jgi:hypothetical protein
MSPDVTEIKCDLWSALNHPGFADAGERQTKARLAVAINDVLQRRGLPAGFQ